ncbi:histidine phosphatase family protein [Chloroflexota bacterium]
MTRILLVRHGQIQLNNPMRFWGQTDLELTETGVRQINALKARLDIEDIDHVFVSDLKRTRRSAEILTGDQDIPTEICPDIRELNFGSAEGLSYQEICQQYPELAGALMNWKVMPKFPGGETMDAFESRVKTFHDKLIDIAGNQTVLVVAHSGSLRMLICHLLGLSITSWRDFQLDLASLSVVNYFANSGRVMLGLFNDTCHLEDISIED